MQFVPRPPGRLKLGPRLAVGGMGELFRAKMDVGGGEVDCVVKTLLPGVGELERALFLREARALAALTRLPARRFAHLLAADAERLVLELVEGADLGAVFAYRRRRGRPMPLPAVVALGVALCEALVELEVASEAGERLGLVHRDLHPGNVLVSQSGEVKVIDLGVATFSALETTSANPRGTLAYMAPEQLREGRVSAASDLYAVGLMLWEALVGEPARPPGDAGLGELLAFRHAAAERPGARRDGVPVALDAWVVRALSVEAPARPSAAEFLDGLLAVALELGGEAGAAALARVVEPLVGEGGQPVRAAPTLGPARGEVRGEVAAPSDAVQVAARVGVPAGEPARRRSGWWLAGVAGVGLAVAVVVMSAPATEPKSTDPTSTEPRSTVLDSAEAGGAATSGSGTTPARSGTTPGLSGTTPALSGTTPALSGTTPALSAPTPALSAPTPALSAPTPALSAPTELLRSTVLDNAEAGSDAGAGSPTPPQTPPFVPTARPTEPRSTVLDSAKGGRADPPRPTPQPPTLTVLPLDGPLHVSGLGASDLAPQTTAPLADRSSGLLRLTGGSPPMTALVRITHQDGALSATVGAPPGEVFEVACGGRTRPTPAAGLTIKDRLACRVTASDGRVLGFALRP